MYAQLGKIEGRDRFIYRVKRLGGTHSCSRCWHFPAVVTMTKSIVSLSS